jgi:hypothetical protein
MKQSKRWAGEYSLSEDKLPFPGKWLLADNEVIIYFPAACNKHKYKAGHHFQQLCVWLQSPLDLKPVPTSSTMVHNFFFFLYFHAF